MAGRKPSKHAEKALIDELRDAVGDEAVDRADIDVERAVRESGRRTTPETSRSGLMLVIFVALGVVVAGVVALALQSWIVLVALLGVHAIATAVVVSTTLRRTTEGEKPAPTTAARLEDEGVDDPEGALNQLVRQATEDDDATRRQPEATKREPSLGDVGAPKQPHTGPKILAVVSEPVSGDELRLAVEAPRADDAEVLVVAPALNTRTQYWLSDPDPAIERAERVQEETVQWMAEEGIDAGGDTGESDPVLAVEDALTTFPADEIVLFTHAQGERNWLEEGVVDEVAKRFDRPVKHLVI